MSGSGIVRDMVRIQPGRPEWPVAVRAMLCTLIPLLVLLATDRLAWSPYAAFGAFAALYGRNVPLPRRLRMQAEAGTAQVLSVLVGVLVGLSPERAWLLVPVAAIWVTGMAMVSHRRTWHPPGVLFQSFALGACGSMTQQPQDILPAVLVCAAVVGLCLLLTWLASYLWFVSRHRVVPLGRREHPKPPPAAMPGAGPEWPLRHYLVRYAVGILIAGSVATAIGIGHPYWAIVSVVVPMAAPTTPARTLRGAQRVVGTLAGVLVAGGVLALGMPPLALIVVIAALTACAELAIGRNYVLALLFITPLALCMVQLGHPLPVGQLVADRAIETVLGIAVALVITLLTHERRQPGDDAS